MGQPGGLGFGDEAAPSETVQAPFLPPFQVAENTG